jgi:hypothetical protein
MHPRVLALGLLFSPGLTHAPWVMAQTQRGHKAAQAVEAFLAPAPLPSTVTPAFEAAVAFQTMDRLLDMMIALGVILAIYLLGLALRRTAFPTLRPPVFASTVLAIPMLFAVNMDFYDVHRVSVDRAGITTHRYMSPDEHIRWAEVTDVQVVDGALFPVVTDDRALRFVTDDGTESHVPRYLPRADAVAAYALAQLSTPSGDSTGTAKERTP